MTTQPLLADRFGLMIVETVRRERRWTSAGATSARELDRSNAAPISSGWSDPFASGFRAHGR
jgi:hypothetical protein